MLPKNCGRCHKLFRPTSTESVCPLCQQADELDFKLVKDYLYEHPGASAGEVSTELDVSMRIIKYYLREERLYISHSNDHHFLDCEKCGEPISSGHYCPKCLFSFHNKALLMNNEAAANFRRMNPDKFPSNLSFRYSTKVK